MYRVTILYFEGKSSKDNLYFDFITYKEATEFSKIIIENEYSVQIDQIG
jgi:hypothetical protein